LQHRNQVWEQSSFKLDRRYPQPKKLDFGVAGLWTWSRYELEDFQFKKLEECMGLFADMLN